MASLIPSVPLPWFRVALGMNPARLRFWGVVVPIHAVAFTALYLGNLKLLDAAYSEAGVAAARRQVEQLVRELPTMMPSIPGERSPHLFGHLISMHQPIRLRLYSVGASLIWPPYHPADADEAARVQRLMHDNAVRDDVWLEKRDGRQWLRGVVRVNTGEDCRPCHAAGKTLGAASVTIDFTDELNELHAILRRRVGWLFGIWIVLVGGVAFVAQKTIRRSLSRLESELDHAAAGRAPSEPAGDLPLDAASAAFHGRLRDFLRRQRAREVEMVSRLERVDQLATLGELSAGLAHEIKNPLAGIQGALEVLKHDTADDATGRLYDEMLGELKRVNTILQRLLESGRPAPLRLSRTNLERLIAETVTLMRPALSRKKVDLSAAVEDDLPEIRADAAKVRQVLVNLVQNAAEAMGESGGSVRVRAGKVPDGDGVVLAVEDDGPGIPREGLDHLFEPFYTTKFTGTGLGLTISKSLVEQHGGHMEFVSEPGRGTTFFVFLPSGDAADDASPLEKAG
ncbi:MAG TPA: ATP-binding protein [Thermoanaerobaculia bacterium]|nr:ATP-binding protein [Thermoanaerobaculia bacterium]